MYPSRIGAAFIAIAVLLVVAAGGLLPRAIHATAAGHGDAGSLSALSVPTGDEGVVIQAAPTAQAVEDDDGGGAGTVFGVVIALILTVVMIAATWKIFTKAGRAGWLAIIPIVNTVVLLGIVGRPVWWIVLFFIPLVNFIIWIVVAIDFAKSYGRSPAFGVVLLGLFSTIGILILGYGKDEYRGPAAATA